MPWLTHGGGNPPAQPSPAQEVNMVRAFSGRRLSIVAVPLVALAAPVAFATSASAQAERSYFFEETAEAFWAVSHQCPDGSTVTATLLVRSARDFEAPETEDADPTARVQYLAVCSGRSFSWAAAATITSTENLKSVTATGSARVRDNSGVFHNMTFDVAWTGFGPLETSVDENVAEGFSVNTSTRKQREATADGRVTFDGNILVDGAANPPAGRPNPFIRTDEERTTRMPSQDEF